VTFLLFQAFSQAFKNSEEKKREGKLVAFLIFPAGFKF